MAFCPLQKRLGTTMLRLICLRFLMLWCFSLQILMSWFFGLGIQVSWYICLHDLVFIIIVKTKKSRIIIWIILLKNISIVLIYAISIWIMLHNRIKIINRILYSLVTFVQSMTTCKGSQNKTSTILYR